VFKDYVQKKGAKMLLFHAVSVLLIILYIDLSHYILIEIQENILIEIQKRKKLMKTIKIILLLTTISIFTSVPYGVAKAEDCSNPKGFHAKLMCKLKGGSGSSVTAAEATETNAGDGSTSWIKKFLGKKDNEVTGR